MADVRETFAFLVRLMTGTPWCHEVGQCIPGRPGTGPPHTEGQQLAPRIPKGKKSMKRLLILFFLLSLLVGCGGEPTPIPDLVATQIAVEEAAHATMTAKAPIYTSTPEPTDTSSPTNTPSPTSTPTPTDTPTPKPTRTAIPTDEPSAAFEEYTDDVVDEVLHIADGLSRIGELLQAPDLNDQGWITDLASAVVTIRFAYEALEEMDVALEFQDFHDIVLDATVDCYDAMDYLVSGIDNRDADDLDRASELIENCSQKVGEVTEMIKSAQE